MGTTASKSTSETLNDIAVEAVQRTVQNCTTTASQDQIMQVDYVMGNVDISGSTFTQGMTVDMQCMMSDTKQSEISNTLANAINQFADAKSKGLLVPPGGTEAETINDITNRIKTGLTQESIQNSMTDVSQSQKIQFGFIGKNFTAKNVSMTQTMDVIAKSIVQTAAVQAIINDVSNVVDQKSTSESTGAETAIAEGLFGMLGAWAYGVIGVVVIISLLLFGFMFYFFFGGSEEQQDKRRAWVQKNIDSASRSRGRF